MIEINPFFEQSEKPSSMSRVWRCFTLEHFVSELNESGLFFARANKVSDQMDSEIPEFDLKMEQEIVKYLKDFYGKDYDLATGSPEGIRKENRAKDRRNTVMNCWRIDEEESITMWSNYEPKVIAISSTIGSLHDAITDERFPITFGKVDYIDDKNTGIGRDWIFNRQFFTKKKKWSWENEYRAVVADNYRYSNQEDYSIDENGLYVRTDFDKLISTVHLSPCSDISQKEIECILQNYNLKKNVIRSNFK